MSNSERDHRKDEGWERRLQEQDRGGLPPFQTAGSPRPAKRMLLALTDCRGRPRYEIPTHDAWHSKSLCHDRPKEDDEAQYEKGFLSRAYQHSEPLHIKAGACDVRTQCHDLFFESLVPLCARPLLQHRWVAAASGWGYAPPMTNNRYSNRRAQFLSELGDTIAVISAGKDQIRNDDVEHPFRQDSDFFFLTGFSESEAVAVFDPANAAMPYTLFVLPRDAEKEAWEGRRAGVTGAVERYGADQAHPVDEFEAWLRKRLVGRQAVAVAPDDGHRGAVARAIAATRRLHGRLGTGAPDHIQDPGTILHEMRLVKSEDEIGALREACRISALAHVEAMRFAQPGRSEHDVQAAIEYVFSSMGSERIGYGSIVAGGANAVILHYIDNDRELRDGDLLLIDAAAEFQHLTADITRTFPINGVFTAPQRAVYELVLDAEQRVIDMCRPGLPYTDMHDKAVEIVAEGLVELGLLPGTPDECVAKGWYREFFFHGTGHWLGIDVHDAGSYGHNGATRPLVPGMALTVEPGIYVAPDKTRLSLSESLYDTEEVIRLSFEMGAADAKALFAARDEESGSANFEVPEEFLGIGVRIEDDILITASGYENMSEDAPRGIEAIEAICAEDSQLPVLV
jgi:Xaa-Pro aminopeptidase